LTEWKNSNTSPEQAMKETYAQGADYFYACAFVDYERKCREQGWLDFESLIKEAVLLLKTNPEVRARNQKKYLSVDECQDTNFTQFELLKLLYTGNIFCVGDENQLVYEFRDAQPGNLSNFSQTFPGAKTLFLGQNFRSTKRIVSFLKKILPTDNGIASHMMSEREDGVDPTFTEYFDDFEEAAGVLSQITDIRNTAVIARTNRQLHMFQKRCMAQNIKSKIIGKNDLWHRNEIKHLITLAKDRKHDQRSASTVLTELISQNNLAYIYRNSGGLNESDPVENLNDFVKMSGNKGTVSEFLDWLRRLTYAKATDKNPILTLGTTHQMKGREAKHVFVIGLKQGLMPHKDGEFLEEKRIWFVACSRACDFLHISYYGNPSEFILEFLEEADDGEETEK
jgi:superfamily I DNA/RNA helicase